jgi:K+-sensing histidine kinase KdpD
MKKVLVCITAQTNGQRLIDRGHEIVSATGGELHILHVKQGNSIFDTEESSKMLEWLFNYGSERGGAVHALCGQNVLKTIRHFIREEGITNIVLGASPSDSGISGESSVDSFKRIMPYLQIHILEPAAEVL